MTKQRIIILCVLIAAAFAAAGLGVTLLAVRIQFIRVRANADPTLEWHDFTPDSGEFTASFPGIPLISSERLPQGPELVHAAIVDEQSRVFKVQWQHISPTESQITPMLKNNLVQVMQRHHAFDVVPTEMTDPTAAELGCSGRGIVNGMRVQFRCRVAYAHETAFIVLWAGATGSTSPADVDKFFQSFDKSMRFQR